MSLPIQVPLKHGTAILLCNKIPKHTLINYSRGVIFSTAPSFLTTAGVRAGYQLLASEDGQKVLHQSAWAHPQPADVPS